VRTPLISGSVRRDSPTNPVNQMRKVAGGRANELPISDLHGSSLMKP
jgi:hypothetical protein